MLKYQYQARQWTVLQGARCWLGGIFRRLQLVGCSAPTSETGPRVRADLPTPAPHRARGTPATGPGVLGTVAVKVTVPLGTIAMAGDAFRDCAGLAQVTVTVGWRS